MFSGFLDFFSCGMALDIGTSCTRVFVRGQGVVLNQPTIVAISGVGGKGAKLNIGFGAAEMLGRAPPHIEVSRPFQGGVIADFDVAQDLFKEVIRRVSRCWKPLSRKVAVCVPYGANAVDRRALKEAAESAGVHAVFVIEAPISAAIGAGLPINETEGSMVVNIGGGTTEIALMALGEIIHCRSIRVGGDRMTEAIQTYLRRHRNVHVGVIYAEKLKREMGSALPPVEDVEVSMEVTGSDIASGLPKRLMVREIEVYRALSDVIALIAAEIRSVFDEVSAEFLEDVADRGIVLTGGGSLLRRMDEFVHECSNVAVSVPDQPTLSVVVGAGRAMGDPRRFSSVIAER